MKTIDFPSKLLSREKYISRIRPFVRKNIIKVLSGQRRVGKSYVLFQLMQEVLSEDKSSNIIYINKESFEYDFIRDAKDLNDYVLAKSVSDGYNYVFIDEIQDIKDFEKALRSLLLNEKNDIYITGSNANLLSGELATFLSGRYIEFNIYSLSYPEFLAFHEKEDSDDNLMLYFLYGGLPYLINLPLNEQCREYLKSVYNTIVFRDVVARYNIRNTVILEKLIAFLADSTGSLFSAKKISDFLKNQKITLASHQIQTYTEYLSNAFLLHKVARYDIKGKRIFEIGEKFYFEDLGIRNTISGYKPDDLGKILENVVYSHLLYLGWEVKVGKFDAYEIDFICTKNGETMYVQVALNLSKEETIEREFGNLLKIKDNYPKLVVTNEKFSGNTYDGVRHMHIREFLMNM